MDWLYYKDRRQFRRLSDKGGVKAESRTIDQMVVHVFNGSWKNSQNVCDQFSSRNQKLCRDSPCTRLTLIPIRATSRKHSVVSIDCSRISRYLYAVPHGEI